MTETEPNNRQRPAVPRFAGLASVRLENGTYQLSWAAASHDHTDPASIQYGVFISESPGPENYDFVNPVASVVGATSISIDAGRLDTTKRHYFIVRAWSKEGMSDLNTIEQADRTLRLSGEPNFRDFGGYINSDGKQVRWGRLYRSAHLAHLTPEDMARVQSLGLNRVMDLRPDVEKTGRTDKTYPGNEDKYDLLPCIVSDPYLLEEQPTSQLASDPRQFDWPNLHIYMIEPNKEHIKLAFDRYADPSQYPILHHCSQGKDRAGIFSALVLWLLKVPQTTIVEDYMLTQELVDTQASIDEMRRYIEANAETVPDGVTAEHWEPAMSCAPERMTIMFSHLDRQYGGIEGFLESIGVTDTQRQAIRDILLKD
ncbi:tyrosine-protein phosphatase [Chloroflexota bacterium]